MAEGNDDDLISTVRIDGVEGTVKVLDDFGERGSAAFEKVSAAAAKAGAILDKASAGITKGFAAVANAIPEVNAEQRLERIGNAAQSLTASLRDGIGTTKNFAIGLAGVGLAGIGAIAGIGKFASSVTAKVREVGRANVEATQTAMQLNRQDAQGANMSAEYASNLAKLRRQLTAGTLDWRTYGSAVRDLNRDYDESRDALLRNQQAQQEALRENLKLQRAAAQTQAYNDLARTFGGPLTNSLIRLGNTYDTVKKKVVDAFSPAIASIVDRVTKIIEGNSASIAAFAEDAAARLKGIFDLISTDQAIGVIKGIIASLGTLIAIVSAGLKGLYYVAEGLASLFNTVFGTDINGALLLMLGFLLKLTGGFKFLWSAVTIAAKGLWLIYAIFGPIGILVAALVVALVWLGVTLMKIDWAATAKRGTDAWEKLKAWFTALPGYIGGLFVRLWEWVKSLAVAAVDFIIARWKGFLVFMAGLPAVLGGLLTTLWEGIKAAALVAVDYILAQWQRFVTFITTLPETVRGLLSSLWDMIKQGFSDAIDWVIAKFNEFVEFIKTVPDLLKEAFVAMGVAIFNAFDSALEGIKSKLSEWKTAVLGYIQPVIDALEKLRNMGGGTPQIPGVGNRYAGGGSPWANSNQRLRGPGTSTSDSIAAWLSKNEFVMRAKAVQKYGVGFMQAINAGKLDLGSIIHRAAGGLASTMMRPGPVMRFADGGLAGGSSEANQILNLSIGGEQFNGLIMPADVADKLTQYAVAKQARSGGRKPSWVGGRS